MKTGNTVPNVDGVIYDKIWPQWSPVMKTGNTLDHKATSSNTTPPQWSPVMKTGNTFSSRLTRAANSWASMEPGHEDREYSSLVS